MRKGLGYHNRRSPFGFNPGTLFAGGAAGVWYDPSDASTLFSDTAGTTPSPTPGGGALSVVGLMLDKSQGLALGSELVTNGTFDTNINGWTTPANATNTQTWSSGALRLSRTSSTTASSAPITTVIGKTYQVSVSRTLVSGDLASGYIKIANTADASAAQIAAFTSSGVFTATATTTYVMPIIFPNAAVVDFDNISVKELAGNHAIRYGGTTTAPELLARVNLLTYSEQFDNAAWVKATATVTANTAVAPDGTTTADTFAATASPGFVYQTFSASAVLYTISVYAKANTANQIRLDFVTAAFALGGSCTFTLTGNGSASAITQYGGSTGYTASIQDVGNGWYRCSMTGLATAATTWYHELAVLSSGQSVFIWGADLRPANIGTSVPAYQRIADQYTYDSNGFPRYLKFDGIDDGMYTPANLDLSGTNKVTVFAGVRKLSDASYQAIAELSNNPDTTTNSFTTGAATATGDASRRTWAFGSRGSDVLSLVGAAIYASPISNVITGIGNISAPLSALRVNGSQITQATISQGTGNYGNYPLNIGVRSATATPSLFLNGYLYSLIVVGAASTAAQISSTESWINVKEGGVY